MEYSTTRSSNVNGTEVSNFEQSQRNEAKSSRGASSKPNVRIIPIHVEGYDKPLLNDTVDSKLYTSQAKTIFNDIPQTGSISSRNKEIPVRNMGQSSSTFSNSSKARSQSPRNKAETYKTETNRFNATHQAYNQNYPSQGILDAYMQSECNEKVNFQPQAPIDPIEKIQQIQKEILELMDKIENYKGGPRNCKEYMYLDEMLTQNLLKLDQIDADGKDNIKSARKEAIKFVNKCISLLESKMESFEKLDELEQQQHQYKHGTNNIETQTTSAIDNNNEVKTKNSL